MASRDILQVHFANALPLKGIWSGYFSLRHTCICRKNIIIETQGSNGRLLDFGLKVDSSRLIVLFLVEALIVSS